MSAERTCPGCHHLTVGAHCLASELSPSKAVEGMAPPAGVLEGPGVPEVAAILCSVAGSFAAQENCTAFKPRTEEDDERDGWV